LPDTTPPKEDTTTIIDDVDPDDAHEATVKVTKVTKEKFLSKILKNLCFVKSTDSLYAFASEFLTLINSISRYSNPNSSLLRKLVQTTSNIIRPSYFDNSSVLKLKASDDDLIPHDLASTTVFQLMRDLASAMSTASYFRKVDLPLGSPIRTSAARAFAEEKGLLSSLLDHLLIHFDVADRSPTPVQPPAVDAPIPETFLGLPLNPPIQEPTPEWEVDAPISENTSRLERQRIPHLEPHLSTIDENDETAFAATQYNKDTHSVVKKESNDVFYMSNLDGTDKFYPEPTMNSIEEEKEPVVKPKKYPMDRTKVPKEARDKDTTYPLTFALFVTTFARRLETGASVQSIIDATAEVDHKANPFEKMAKLNRALAASALVVNSDDSNEESVVYRCYGDEPPPWVHKKAVKAQLSSLDSLACPAILKGQSRRTRLQLLERSNTTMLLAMHHLKTQLAELRQSILPKELKLKKAKAKKNYYDLDAMGLKGLESVLQNSHLSPDAAFSAHVPRVKLSPTTAILDSGASKHFVTPTMANRFLRRRRIRTVMCNANGKTTTLDQGGDLDLDLRDANGIVTRKLPLLGACVVPDSTFNLISLGMLLSDGADIHFSRAKGSYMEYGGLRYPLRESDGLTLIDFDKGLTESEINDTWDLNTDFHMDSLESGAGSIGPAPAAGAPVIGCAAPQASMETWHARLGHVHNDRINHLNKTGSALGLNVKGRSAHNANCMCEVCLKCNNIRRSVATAREFEDEISRKGELITSDLMGPFPPTPEGHRYAISFVDEFSRYSVVYFLNKKSQSTDALHAFVKYYSSMNIIVSKIRTDQGGEYGGHHERVSYGGSNSKMPTDHDKEVYSPAFVKVCEKYKITPELAPAYKPQLHSVAERYNRTVMSMANSMLYKARISPILWSSAIAHANLIRNRLPTRARGGLTPYELFTNRRPRFDNLRIWGCFCYKLLPKISKIPGLPVRKRLIYVGDSQDRIGFRCFDPIEYKFTTEYELIFDEDSVAQRSSLLDAFDNRRKLATEGRMDEIPLISQSRISDGQRAVFLGTEITTGDLTSGPDIPGQMVTPISEPLAEAEGPIGTELEGAVHPPPKNSICNDGRAELITPTKPRERSGSGGFLETDSPTSASDRTSTLSCSRTDSSATNPPESKANSDHQTDKAFGNLHSADTNPDVLTNNGTVKTSTVDKPIPPHSSLSVHAAEYAPVPRRHKNESRTQQTEKTLVYSGVKEVPTSAKPNPPGTLLRSEFDVITDDQADQHGPLAATSFKEVNLASSFDLSDGNLRCPKRYLPVGQAQPTSPELKAFLVKAREQNIRIAIQQDNPKSGKSGTRYELTKGAQRAADYNLFLSAVSMRGANADFEWDVLRGYITFPDNTRTTDTPPSYACATTIGYDVPFNDLDENTLLKGTFNQTLQDQLKAMWPHDPEMTQEQLLAQQVEGYALVQDLLVDSIPEPATYKKAIAEDQPEKARWAEAIDTETNNLLSRTTWEYVPKSSLPKYKRPTRCKYIFKKKLNKDGSLKYKARLVLCGYSQVAGEDYSSDELYASVCSYASMRYLMSLSTQKGHILYQSDIQAAYLESHITEDLYMEVPPNLSPVDENGAPRVCKIKRGIYGAKQAGHAWAKCFKEFMTSPEHGIEFTPMTGESNLYRKSFTLNGVESEIYVGQYVDDTLISASSDEVLKWFLKPLERGSQ
jgi:hypothetical protein